MPPDPFLDASILLVKGIDSVADGHAYHGNPREHTNDTKSQPTTELLQRVLNTSPVRHTEYWCQHMFGVARVHVLKVPNTSVTYVTCERSISSNPFISLERTPCPVQQCCTAGSDDKKIGLQKHANTSTRGRKTFSASTAKVPSFYPLPSFLLDYERAVLSFANKPCARNTLRNSPRSPTVIPMRREKSQASDFMLQVEAFVNLIKETRFLKSTRLE